MTFRAEIDHLKKVAPTSNAEFFKKESCFHSSLGLPVVGVVVGGGLSLVEKTQPGPELKGNITVDLCKLERSCICIGVMGGRLQAASRAQTHTDTHSGCSYITGPLLSCMTFRKKYIYSHLYLAPPPYPLGQVQMLTLVDFVYIWPALFWELQTFMGECKHIVVSRLIAISSPQSV